MLSFLEVKIEADVTKAPSSGGLQKLTVTDTKEQELLASLELEKKKKVEIEEDKLVLKLKQEEEKVGYDLDQKALEVHYINIIGVVGGNTPPNFVPPCKTCAPPSANESPWWYPQNMVLLSNCLQINRKNGLNQSMHLL